jgi:hypothetical protein
MYRPKQFSVAQISACCALRGNSTYSGIKNPMEAFKSVYVFSPYPLTMAPTRCRGPMKDGLMSTRLSTSLGNKELIQAQLDHTKRSEHLQPTSRNPSRRKGTKQTEPAWQSGGSWVQVPSPPQRSVHE